jgi:hypothetical protein
VKDKFIFGLLHVCIPLEEDVMKRRVNRLYGQAYYQESRWKDLYK